MRVPSILALIAVLTAVLLFTSDAPASASSPRGDVNCSGAADGRDALDLLLTLTGEDVSLPDLCQPIGQANVDGLGGDVNCDNEFDLLDLIAALKLAGGLPIHPCFAVTLSAIGGVSQVVGADGGTLTTTGPDGTEFTLEVPQGALAGAQLISMQPVESIANLPIGGGLVAAVDLQPSGLQLWEPVILTIDPVAEIPVADQTAFMISEGEFVLHPFVLDSAEMKLPLIHFSTPGVGSGAPGSTPPPSSPADAYFARIASILAAERAAQLSGQPGDPNFMDNIGDIMSEYFNDVIFPDLLAAANDCDVATRVIPAALGFARQAALLGMDQRFEIEIDAALETIGPALINCREEAFDRCVDDHDLTAITDIISYTRSLQLFGGDTEPSPMQEMIEKCARFEIDFESWFCVDDMSANCTTGIDYSFRAEDVPFSPPIVPSQQPLGGAQMEMFRNEWGPSMGCQGSTTSPGSLFQVLSGGPAMNLFQSNGPQPAAEITIVINPGIPPETLSLTCADGSGDQETTLWWQKWCSWHQDELSPPYSDTTSLCYSDDQPFGWGFAITDWQFNGGELYARKVYDRAYTEVGALEIGFETTTIELWHRPIH
jgi:hypothetical protein